MHAPNWIGILQTATTDTKTKRKNTSENKNIKDNTVNERTRDWICFPTSAVLLSACCTMLARAPVTRGTQQRHEVANAKCPSSREGPRWHSTCRKLSWRNPASLIVFQRWKSLGSPTSQAQETNLISNHRWQLWIEVIQTDWTTLWVFISSHQFKVICLSHLSKKPEQFPSNWSCWAIPNGRHRVLQRLQ